MSSESINLVRLLGTNPEGRAVFETDTGDPVMLRRLFEPGVIELLVEGDISVLRDNVERELDTVFVNLRTRKVFELHPMRRTATVAAIEVETGCPPGSLQPKGWDWDFTQVAT